MESSAVWLLEKKWKREQTAEERRLRKRDCVEGVTAREGVWDVEGVERTVSAVADEVGTGDDTNWLWWILGGWERL